MNNGIKTFCGRRLGILLVAAMLMFVAVPAQSMPSDGALIVPILPLLLVDDADPSLPLADAGPNAEVLVGELVQLDGSASADPNSLPITFLWSFKSKPVASTATLNFADIVKPEFILDVPGAYVVQLVVNNGVDDSPPSSVTITNTNRAPIADAGDNAVVPLAELVTLDGTASSDIDTDLLTFNWVASELPLGSAALLSDPSSEIPTFTPDVKGNYVFDLIVNDGRLDSEVDPVEILAGVELSLRVDDVFFGVDRETVATLSLDLPAPSQGIVLVLAVDEAIIGLSAAQLTFNEGETEKSVTLTGLQIGVTSLTASADNIDEVSVDLEVSGALISIDELETLSPSASRSVAISLSDAAPIGGLTIGLESLDTAVATIVPASLFIAQGQFVPNENAQVTGVGIGATRLRATAVGFAPDERDVEVALAAEFEPSNLNVPETLSRDIVLKLDAPAPQQGVTFDLSIIGDAIFSTPSSVTIAEGQTQSLPITLLGLSEGVSVLRASATGFVDADAQITVVDAPNVFLSRNGSSSHLVEAGIGVQLQNSFRFRLEVAPPNAVDFVVSVPLDSGVLISRDSSSVGAASLVIEDVLSTITPFVTFQGIEIGDDVPLSIEVFDANTTNPAGYESLVSTIDVDPSGVFVPTADFTTTTFSTNRTVAAQTALLHDNDSGGEAGTFRQSQRVRGGTSLQIPMQVDDSAVLSLPDGATGNLTIASNSTTGTIALTPHASGEANVSIASQPDGFILPSNRAGNALVTVTAPDAFIKNFSSNSPLSEAIVGLNLQRPLRVGFEIAPLMPVDVQISVPAGAALSSNAASIGSSSILLQGVSSTQTQTFFLQGLALGDDVPITVNVFNAGTTTPAGFNILSSTVDVDPSGIAVATADYATTTFSSNRSVSVQASLLFDAETPAREGERSSTQAVRGGLDLVVPLQTSDVAIASLPAGANDDLVILAGANQASISVEPVAAGQTTVSIASLPIGFSIPTNQDDFVAVTVSAANAFLRSLSSNSHLVEAIVGIDLQASFRVGLAATPPSPVDIVVSVPTGSGVLLAPDSTTVGSTSINFDGLTSTSSPSFFIQGAAIGDNVAVTIEVFEENSTTPIGYNVLASTVDVDPSGVYVSTSDYTTNTFAANRSLAVFSTVLFDDEASPSRVGEQRANQAVRAGLSLAIPMLVDDATVVVLPAGATDTLIIPPGQLSGNIDIDPQTAGATIVSITEQPNANFILPSDRDDRVAITVTAPEARLSNPNILVGDELQIPIVVTLEEAPPNAIDVSVEISSSAVALISDTGTIAGADSVVFANVSTRAVGTIFIQGIVLDAATQVKVSAPGYNDGTSEVQVVNSGFSLTGNFNSIDAGSTRSLTVRSERLNANGTFSTVQAVRGGASFDLVVSSSAPGVGVIESPITLSGGSNSTTTEFSAVAPGTTTLEITQPPEFTPPVGRTDGDITVQ